MRATQLSYPAGVEPAHTKNVETRRAHILWIAPRKKMTQKILIKLDTVFYKTLVSETQSRNVIEIWFHFETCDFGDLVGEETGVPGENQLPE